MGKENICEYTRWDRKISQKYTRWDRKISVNTQDGTGKYLWIHKMGQENICKHTRWDRKISVNTQDGTGKYL